jgi:hypothetical protein
MSNLPEENLSDDLCWGTEAIARAIGRTKRQAYHLLHTKQLPAKKVGAFWVASRANLRQALVAAGRDQVEGAR